MLNSFHQKTRLLFNELQLASRMSTWMCDFATSHRSQQDLCLLGDYLSATVMNLYIHAKALIGFVSEPFFATLYGVFSLLQSSGLCRNSILLNETTAMDTVIERFANMTVMTMNDPHIVLPHIREQQQQRLPAFFTHPRFKRVVMASKYCQKHLVPTVLRLCCTKDKAQLTRQANTLTLAFQGLLLFDQPAASPDTSAFVDSFRDVAANDKELFYEVLNNIFEGTNATISNFYTSLDSVCFRFLLMTTFLFFHVFLSLNRFRTHQVAMNARFNVLWKRLASLQ